MNRSLMAFFVLLFCSCMHSYAQDDGTMDVQKIRKNVYTQVLSLNDDEAKRFWPVFDEMQAKLNEIKNKSAIERKNINDNYATLTDAQMERSLDNLLDYEQQSLDIQKKYYDKFKKLLPIKKVALLPKADREFKKKILLIYQKMKDAAD